MRNTINWFPVPQILPTDFRINGLTNGLQHPEFSLYQNCNQVSLNQNLHMPAMEFSPLLNRLSLLENYRQSLRETENMMKLTLIQKLTQTPLIQHTSNYQSTISKQNSVSLKDGLELSSKKIHKAQRSEKVKKVAVQKKENEPDGPANITKRKKYRRKAAEIIRQFKCPYEQCHKSYGVKFALKNHIRIKHQTERIVCGKA